MHARAQSGAGVRGERGRGRRRLLSGSADGRYQPALHRRLSRDIERAFAPLRTARQSSPTRQRAWVRHQANQLAPHDRHERSRLAPRRDRTGKRERCGARRTVGDHPRERNHGDSCTGHGRGRSRATTWQYSCRLDGWSAAHTDPRARPACNGCHVAAAERCAPPKSGADARRWTSDRACGAVRQHRARLQQSDRHTDRAGVGRCRRHGSRIRVRPGR